MKFIPALLAATTAVTLSFGANAQSTNATNAAATGAAATGSYPSQPIRLIVPFPPGGGTDILSRIISNELGKQAGWSVVVENRAGAGGTIGITEAARAAPNGYEMVMGQKDNLIIGSWVYKDVSWNPVTDFQPVAHVAFTPIVIATAVQSPYKSLKDVIEAARTKPASITYGHPGSGTSVHLAGHEFAKAVGIDLTHVPYKGSNAAMVDALAGNVDLLMSSLPSAMSQIKAGKLRPLAVTSAKRSPLFADVPTVAEAAGIQNFDISTWYGLLMPKGAPAEAVQLVHQRVNQLIEGDQTTRAAILEQGAEPLAMSVEDFAKLIAKEHKEWEVIVRESGAAAN